MDGGPDRTAIADRPAPAPPAATDERTVDQEPGQSNAVLARSGEAEHPEQDLSDSARRAELARLPTEPAPEAPPFEAPEDPASEEQAETDEEGAAAEEADEEQAPTEGDEGGIEARAPESGGAGEEAVPRGGGAAPAPPLQIAPPEPLAFELPAGFGNALALSPEEEQAIAGGRLRYDPAAARAEVAGLVAQLQGTGRRAAGDLIDAAGTAKRLVVDEALAQMGAVSAVVTEKMAELDAHFELARGAVMARAASAKARVSLIMLTGYLRALTTSAVTSLQVLAVGERHKTAASTALRAAEAEVREFGRTESERARTTVDEQVAEARRRGQEKAAAYPDTGRGDAQRQAVLSVAEQAAQSLGEPKDELAEGARDAGDTLADGIGEGLIGDVTERIDAAVVQTLLAVGRESLSLSGAFGRMTAAFHRGIDQHAAAVVAQLDRAQAGAKAQLRRLEDQYHAMTLLAMALMLEALEDQLRVALAFVAEVVDRTGSTVLAIARPSLSMVRQFVRESALRIEDFADGALDAFVRAGISMALKIAQSGAAATAGVDRMVTAVKAAVDATLAAVIDGIMTLVRSAQEGADAVNESWSVGLGEVVVRVDEQLGEAVRNMETELRTRVADAKRQITTELDRALAENARAMDNLDRDMEAAAAEAREKYDAPWYKKLGRWLWSALKSFLLAVLKLLAVIAILVIGIILVIVGIIKGAIILIVLGVILIVGVVVYIVYGIVMGIVERVRSAQRWWQYPWAVVVGILDLVGVPKLIEGIIHHDIVNGRELTIEEAGERFGAGLLDALLFFIPLKAKVRGRPRAPTPETPRLPPGETPRGPRGPETPRGPEGPDTPRGPEGPREPESPRPEEPRPEEPRPEEPRPEEPRPEEPRPEEPRPEEPRPEEPRPEEPRPEEPRPEEPRPEEPRTPEQLEEALRREAEAETGGRRPVRDAADVQRIRDNAPSHDRPPPDLSAADRVLWRQYVDYYHRRLAELEAELARRTDPTQPLQGKRPLDWPGYRDFMGRFRRGRDFERRTTAEIARERADLDVQDNVGVRKPGETTKFVDQLGVERSEVARWQREGGRLPDVEAWSNKSRRFDEIADIDRQVEIDTFEAIDKYGGTFEVRRPQHPLFGQTVRVRALTLVYDARGVSAALMARIRRVAARAAATRGFPDFGVEFRNPPAVGDR